MRVSITGHQRLKNPADWDWVRAELNNILAQFANPLIGVSSLAIGTDQLFAELILQRDSSLEVIVPFPEYKIKFDVRDREGYQRLLDMASKVDVLQRKDSDEQSYFEAGKKVVDLADILIAVWDGQPAAGLGGTADVVDYAVSKGKTIIYLDPVKHVKRLDRKR